MTRMGWFCQRRSQQVSVGTDWRKWILLVLMAAHGWRWAVFLIAAISFFKKWDQQRVDDQLEQVIQH